MNPHVHRILGSACVSPNTFSRDLSAGMTSIRAFKCQIHIGKKIREGRRETRRPATGTVALPKTTKMSEKNEA
jgi:hypothetical protein